LCPAADAGTNAAKCKPDCDCSGRQFLTGIDLWS
jgi:hypothetical protein